MAVDVEFNIAGAEAVMAKLAALGNVAKRKAGRAALRKGGMVVVRAAKEIVSKHDDPNTSRSISKNISIQWNNRRFRATGDLAFRIGVRGGARVPKGHAIPDGTNAATPHWRFLEFGTKTSIAYPFLRPAMANNAQAVSDVFIDAFNKAIDKAIRTGRTE